MRLAAILVLALALAGCGGAGTHGTATVWITRDRGARVLLTATVPAGETAMQALERSARVTTRYGGRFVQAIDGIEGSLSARRDWFYFVNGYESDRGAAEYLLRPGDVEWWDYRSWRGAASVPVVVGAFPEPFLHGFAGRRRTAIVLYGSPRLARAARALAKVVHASRVLPSTARTSKDANLLLLVDGRGPRFSAEPVHRAGDPVRFVLRGDAVAVAHDPRAYRFHYEVR